MFPHCAVAVAAERPGSLAGGRVDNNEHPVDESMTHAPTRTLPASPLFIRVAANDS